MPTNLSAYHKGVSHLGDESHRLGSEGGMISLQYIYHHAVSLSQLITFLDVTELTPYSSYGNEVLHLTHNHPKTISHL